jgi:ribosomal-protein-alanine N-acetyltransferase
MTGLRPPPPAAAAGPPAAALASRPASSADVLRLGSRCLIRRPAPDDEAEFTAARRRNRAFLEPWEPRPAPGLDAFSPAYFRRYLATSNSEQMQRLLICEHAAGAAVAAPAVVPNAAPIVGHIGISRAIPGPPGTAYVGYWLAQDATGRGIMTEALALALDVAFDDMGLRRVEANIQPTNAASLRLVDRLGFRREGYSPQYMQIAGEWRDHVRTAILASEWRARRAALTPVAARTPARCPLST